MRFYAFTMALPALVFVALTPPLASAQEADQATEEDLSASDDAEARQLFQAGREAFQRGRYERALEYFQRAHELSGRAALLYNVAVAADRLRMDEVALAAFEEYLAAVPDAPDREDLEARVRVLKNKLEAEQASAGTEGASEEPPREASGGGAATFLPWITAGVGGAMTVTGVVLLALGKGDIDAVESAELGSRWADVEGQADSGPRLSRAGLALTALGLTAAAGGVVWAIVAGRGDGDGDVRVGVGPGHLALRGSF